MKCIVCGKEDKDVLSGRFCSEECRQKYINYVKLQEKIEGKEKKLDTLDQKLRYCKERGITYAEYQILETLGKL